MEAGGPASFAVNRVLPDHRKAAVIPEVVSAANLPPVICDIVAAYVVGQRFLLIVATEVCLVFDVEDGVLVTVPVPGARRMRSMVVHKGVLFGEFATELGDRCVDALNLTDFTYRRAVETLGAVQRQQLVIWDSRQAKVCAVDRADWMDEAHGWCGPVDHNCFTLLAPPRRPCLYHWRSKREVLFPELCNADRRYTQIVRAGDTYYVCGGLVSSSWETASCGAFTPSDRGGGGGSWKRIASMTHPRYAHRTCVVNNHCLLVVGGRATIGAMSVVRPIEKYNPDTNLWTTAGNLPPKFPTLTSDSMFIV